MPKLSESYLTKDIAKTFEPVARQGPNTPGFSAQPAFPSYNPFLATPLPLLATYQPDALRQFYRGGVPQQRIFPVSGG